MTQTNSTDLLGRILGVLASSVAVFGGIVLTFLVLITIVSIIGRAALSQPIPGDFELVEIGCAIAVFAFLPYCQLVNGNVIVDFVTANASPATRSLLDAVGNLCYTVIAALLTWRLSLGGIDLKNYNESTMVLQVPVWWGFIPGVLCTGLLTLVCAYTAVRSLREFRHGKACQ